MKYTIGQIYSILSLFLLMISYGCSIEAQSNEILEEDERERYLQAKNKAFKAKGEKHHFEGLVCIDIPEGVNGDAISKDQLQVIVMQPDLQFLLNDLPDSSNSWFQINLSYRKFLSERNNPELSWYEDQILANRALTIINQRNYDVPTEDIEYYLQLLLDHNSGNAYIISVFLEKLIGHWSISKIKKAVISTFDAPAFKSVEELQEHRFEYDDSRNSNIELHIVGIEKLEELRKLTIDNK